jgi:hypothetical protein
MAQNEVQIPRDYTSWKTMITTGCKETLTSAYIDGRLKVLKNEKDPFTAKFIQVYGKPYTDMVISWFERAKNDIV